MAYGSKTLFADFDIEVFLTSFGTATKVPFPEESSRESIINYLFKRSLTIHYQS